MSGQSEVFINLLRQVELFSGLSDAELRQIAETAVTLRRAKNQIIFDEGDSADFLLVLTKGRAKVVLVGDGAEEIILNLIEPFRIVGEIALLDRSTRSARLVPRPGRQWRRNNRRPGGADRRTIADHRDGAAGHGDCN